MRRFPLTVAVTLVLAGFAGPASAKGASHAKLNGNSSFAVTDSTFIDFSETTIDGKTKAPEGFFLQGHQAQSMTQMVKLRSKFRSELRNSKSAVKALVK